MLAIDLTGKRALVAGVSDDGGFGFAIAKALAEAGASICLGSWPPALGIFTKLLERGKLDKSMRLSDGRKLEFERIYPLDAAFDTLDETPEEIREILLLVALYCGIPAANEAHQIAVEVLGGAKAQP